MTIIHVFIFSWNGTLLLLQSTICMLRILLSMYFMIPIPNSHLQSLVRFLGEAHRGVRGFVFDESGSPIEGATMKIKDKEVGFRSTRHGEFWRILLPGRHVLEVIILRFSGIMTEKKKLYKRNKWKCNGGKSPLNV